MKLNKYALSLVLAGLMSNASYAKDVNIGVTMNHFDNSFETILRVSMQKKMKEMGSIKSQFEDAKGDAAQQLQQVESFIGQGVDAIIVNPTDTKAMQPIIKRAKAAGIPLVFLNRRPETDLPEKMAYIGSDQKEAGELQMEAVAKILNGKGNVMILMGDLSGEETRGRTGGVEEVAKKYPGIKIVDKQSAKWLREESNIVTTSWLVSGKEFDAIVSNNDEMAIGAVYAAKQNPHEKLVIAGIDGTPDALQFIKSGAMNVTIFQDGKAQADGAVEAAVALVKGEHVEKYIMVPYQVITKDNYKDFVGKNTR